MNDVSTVRWTFALISTSSCLPGCL